MTAKGTSDSSEPESFEEATHSDNKDNWCKAMENETQSLKNDT